MKKILFAVLCLCMAATVYAQSDSSSYFRQMNADGLKNLELVRKIELASQPGAWFIQSSTGHTTGCRHQGWEFGLGASVFYGESNFWGNWSPAGEVSVRYDALYFTKKKAEVDGETIKVPRRAWAVSADLALFPRRYAEEAYSAGECYFAYKTRLNLERRLVRNKWDTFQIYLMASVGYLFQKHDTYVGETQTEKGTELFIVPYTGSGVTYGGGLRMVCNFKHTPWSIQAKGMVERVPSVDYNKTSMTWQFSGSFGVYYQIQSHIK